MLADEGLHFNAQQNQDAAKDFGNSLKEIWGLNIEGIAAEEIAEKWGGDGGTQSGDEPNDPPADPHQIYY